MGLTGPGATAEMRKAPWGADAGGVCEPREQSRGDGTLQGTEARKGGPGRRPNTSRPRPVRASLVKKSKGKAGRGARLSSQEGEAAGSLELQA